MHVRPVSCGFMVLTMCWICVPGRGDEARDTATVEIYSCGETLQYVRRRGAEHRGDNAKDRCHGEMDLRHIAVLRAVHEEGRPRVRITVGDRVATANHVRISKGGHAIDASVRNGRLVLRLVEWVDDANGRRGADGDRISIMADNRVVHRSSE